MGCLMDAVKEFTPEGREIWHIDWGWATMVDLLGDNFDYSSVTRDQLHGVAEGMRDRWRAREAEAKESSGPQTSTEAATDGTGLGYYCRNGHGQQAQAFMIDGVPPHRCPKCGHTPEFVGPALSE